MSDLRFSDHEPTDPERAAVDAILAGAGLDPAVVAEGERLVRGGRTRADQRRHLLLPGLRALQRAAGWVSPGGVNHLGRQLGVAPAEVFGVATFYHLLTTDDPGGDDRPVHHVCVDAACQIAGSAPRRAELEASGARVEPSPCLGHCEAPVAVLVQARGADDLIVTGSAQGDDPTPTPTATAAATAAGAVVPVFPMQYDPELRLLRRVGRIDPTSLEAYVGAGGYRALTQAFVRGAEGVLAEIDASGLTGRGGAAFPTGVKWRAVAQALADHPGPGHVVANADESEPGTFKDRHLLEHDPFALIEALTIAGFATGASQGWIYLRGEYPLAAQRLTDALEQARRAGFLGAGIARSSFEFDIELRLGAGAYVCGEETALFNSIEGYRGEPRQKPPFPTTHGLFGRPTAVNNPETLYNVLDIVTDGAAAFRSRGTDGSPGTKLFCVSGRVARPGLYEVPFGETLAQLLARAGGPDTVQAILLGGAAGTFVGPDQLDLPLTLEATREAGVSLGSGVVMVFDHTVELGPVVRRLAEFFRDESCGQCVPCRVGTQRQVELLAAGPGAVDDPLGLLGDLDRVMKDASICGLGHTASSATRSALALGLIEFPTRG